MMMMTISDNPVTITIKVENHQQANKIVAVLGHAEVEESIDFAFDMQVHAPEPNVELVGQPAARSVEEYEEEHPLKPPITVTWGDIDHDLILSLLDEVGGDGHTIYLTNWFVEKMDIPRELIEQSETVEKADGSHKGAITSPDGQLMDELKGVYGLTLHYRIANDLGVNTDTGLSGRGFQAQELNKRIREYLTPVTELPENNEE